MTMDEGWHTYWQNPGDSGIPISITWSLPEGWKASDIQWPAPQKFDAGGGLVNFGYERSVTLPVAITPAPSAKPGDKVTLSAMAEWLICSKMCLSASEPIEISLEVGDKVEADPAGQAQLAPVLSQLPAATNLKLSAIRNGREVRLSISASASDASWQNAQFFPADETISANAPQHIAFVNGAWVMQLQLSDFAPAHPNRLKGLIKLPDGPNPNVLIDIPIG